MIEAALLRVGRDRLPASRRRQGDRAAVADTSRLSRADGLGAAPVRHDRRSSLSSRLRSSRRSSQVARYAIRSSADVEDGAAHSFAGQFQSVLDVAGTQAAAEAVQTVLEGTSADSVRSYSADRGARADGPASMAVIVQEMVQAEFSGVAFSANPITGFTETIIEAVPGLGEGLMQRGETPERWIRKAGAWRSRPDAPELPENVAEQLAADVAEMARRYRAAGRRRVGAGRWPAELRAAAPHHRHRRDHLLLEPVLPRDAAGHHRAARVVGEHPGRQRRVDRRARQAGRAHGARARRPGRTLLLSRLLQHGHLRHDPGQARTAEGVA